MTFFDEIVTITKNARDIHFIEHDAENLTRFIEKKIKDEILKKAKMGYETLVFDLVCNIDTNYKYSIDELMFEHIVPDFIPVKERLFDETKILQTTGPFEGFKIFSNCGNSITISWEIEDFTTPDRQPQQTVCPPAPMKQPKFLPYAGILNEYDEYGECSQDGNLAYISELLETMFPNLQSQNKFN